MGTQTSETGVNTDIFNPHYLEEPNSHLKQTQKKNGGSQFSFTHKVVTFVILNLALYASYGLYSLPGSFLPLYNIGRGVKLSTTSTIIAAVPLCYVIICPISAWMLDRWSTKNILLASTGFVSAVTFSFALADRIKNNLLYVIVTTIMRLLQGICGGIIDVVVFSMTAKMFPQNLALTTAIVESSLNTALATAPFVGAVLYEGTSFAMAFVAPAATIFLVFVSAIFGAAKINCKRDSRGSTSRSMITVLTDPLIVFPAWHCGFSNLLANYFIPILAVYTDTQFGKGAVFAGTLLLINSVGVILISPILGYLMDKFNPYIFFLISAVTFPITYFFLGPAPFLQGWVPPSVTQLTVALGICGIDLPLACYPSLIIMLDIYKERYGRIPQSVQNFITSLYVAAFPFGACIGVFLSGAVAEHLSFAQSTGVMAIIAVVESVFLFMYCLAVLRLKAENASDRENMERLNLIHSNTYKSPNSICLPS